MLTGGVGAGREGEGMGVKIVRNLKKYPTKLQAFPKYSMDMLFFFFYISFYFSLV